MLSLLASLPGVQSAGVGSDLPWTGYDDNAGFTIEGKQPPPHQEFHARYHMASADYFRALGMPLLRGRFFNDGDKKDAPAGRSIINHALAAALLAGRRCRRKAHHLRGQSERDKDWLTIVGVVGDVKDQPNSPGAEPPSGGRLCRFGAPNMSLVIRADSDPQLLIDAVRKKRGPARPCSGGRRTFG